MKDTEIHDGLSEKEVRNFLSEQIMIHVMPDFRQHEYKPGEDAYVVALNNARIDMMNAQLEISRCETMIGIRNILKSKGWEEFDCSNHVVQTGKNWRNFLGTEEEFNKFMDDNGFED